MAQVAINNTNPSASLDISGQPTNSTIVDGVNPPKLTGDQLKNKDAIYTINQKGTIVYITSRVTTASTKTTNVTSEGFYLFDGIKWQKLVSESKKEVITVTGLASGLSSPNNFSSGTFTPNVPANINYIYINNTDKTTWLYNGTQYKSYIAPANTPWYIATTTNDAGGNKTSNIYRNGNVGIGTSTPTEKLDINGNVKFSGALMPNNLSGSQGQPLFSNGSNTSPTFKNPATYNSFAEIIYPISFVESGGASNFTLTSITSKIYAGKIFYYTNTYSGNKTFVPATGNTLYGPNSNTPVASYTIPSKNSVQMISYYNSATDKGWIVVDKTF